jgi:hypothetical protein
MSRQWEKLRSVNGRPQTRLKIGEYVLLEPAEFMQYGEYAADYTTVLAQPGRYPVYAHRDCGQNWHSLSIPIPGVVVRGSWWNKREAGESFEICLNHYQHGVARAVVEGHSTHIELLPDVTARQIDFVYDGKPGHTFGLFLNETEQL